MRLLAVVAGVAATVLSAAAAQAQQDTAAAKAPMDPENPIGFMMEHKNELSLADSQIVRLGTINTMLTMHNRALKDSLDDLRPGGDRPTPIPVNLSPADRDSLFARRRLAARVSGSIHDNNRAAREQAIAVLSPDQQRKLISIQQRLEEEARMRRPANSSGRPPGAGAPGGSAGSTGGYGGRPY